MAEEFCEDCGFYNDGNIAWDDYNKVFTCDEGHETIIPYNEDYDRIDDEWPSIEISSDA